MSGVSLSSNADNTQAPASLVVQIDTDASTEADVCAEEDASVDVDISFVSFMSSATHRDCVRTRTSNAVSMLYDTAPERCVNADWLCDGAHGDELNRRSVPGPESSFWLPFTFSHCSASATNANELNLMESNPMQFLTD